MKLTCEWCGKRFTKPNSRGPNPKFCSNAHRQAAFAATRDIELKQLRAEVRELREVVRRYREGTQADVR